MSKMKEAVADVAVPEVVQTVGSSLSAMSDDTLIVETKALYGSINTFDCFGVSDLIKMELMERELDRRGYDMIEVTTLAIEKRE